MSLFHFLLCLAKGIVLSLELLVLLLNESQFLVQLLNRTCILSLDVFGHLCVLSLTQTLESLILLLQLIVLLCKLAHLWVDREGFTGSEFDEFSSELDILLHCLLVRLVELLVLCNHALFILKHLIQVFERFRQEQGLVSHHWVDRCQALQIKYYSTALK